LFSSQSIQFHESGKKHKENVAKRLAEIGKKSVKDNAALKSMEKSIKKMEQVCKKKTNLSVDRADESILFDLFVLISSYISAS